MSYNQNKHVHPGEILFEEFLKPLNLSQYKIAQDISVPARRINEIIHGDRRITVDTALRLGRYFKNTPQFWLNLQTKYELEKIHESLSKKIKKEVKILERA